MIRKRKGTFRGKVSKNYLEICRFKCYHIYDKKSKKRIPMIGQKIKIMEKIHDSTNHFNLQICNFKLSLSNVCWPYMYHEME